MNRDAQKDGSSPLAVTDSNPLSIRQFFGLWPFILGVAFARLGTVIAGYNNYSYSDAGFLTDGSTLFSIGILVLMLPIFLRKDHLGKRRAHILALITIGLEGACLLALCLLEAAGKNSESSVLALATGTSLFNMLSTFYWLRRIRGTSPITATVIIFSALIVSELAVYACFLFPSTVAYFIGGFLALSQYFCLFKARTKSKQLLSFSPDEKRDYFGYAKSLISNKRFLCITAIEIGLIAIVIGFLRGYPEGEPIPFTQETRFIYMMLTIVISAGLIYFVVKGKQGVMSLGIWIIMQALASFALISYAAFPDALHIGAIFTTTVNALMVGLSRYIIVAFMTYGRHDPYYYAISGFAVWLGMRTVTRIFLLNFQPLQDNHLLICIIIGSILLLSVQIFNAQNLSMTNSQNQGELEKAKTQKGALARIMGLDEEDSLSDVRRSYMGVSAKEVGEQFLLSEREIEVLTFYALGFTQKRVAEELHISQGTVHTHIKRIYAKTGIHSRQKLLDYIKHHTA